jgi:hypothetical protein
MVEVPGEYVVMVAIRRVVVKKGEIFSPGWLRRCRPQAGEANRPVRSLAEPGRIEADAEILDNRGEERVVSPVPCVGEEPISHESRLASLKPRRY